MSRKRKSLRRIAVDGHVFHWRVGNGPPGPPCWFGCPDCLVLIREWSGPITLEVFHDRKHLFTRSLDNLQSITPSIVSEQVREFLTSTGFEPATLSHAVPQASPTKTQRRRPHQVSLVGRS